MKYENPEITQELDLEGQLGDLSMITTKGSLYGGGTP